MTIEIGERDRHKFLLRCRTGLTTHLIDAGLSKFTSVVIPYLTVISVSCAIH